MTCVQSFYLMIHEIVIRRIHKIDSLNKVKMPKHLWLQ